MTDAGKSSVCMICPEGAGMACTIDHGFSRLEQIDDTYEEQTQNIVDSESGGIPVMFIFVIVVIAVATFISGITFGDELSILNVKSYLG